MIRWTLYHLNLIFRFFGYTFRFFLSFFSSNIHCIEVNKKKKIFRPFFEFLRDQLTTIDFHINRSLRLNVEKANVAKSLRAQSESKTYESGFVDKQKCRQSSGQNYSCNYFYSLNMFQYATQQARVRKLKRLGQTEENVVTFFNGDGITKSPKTIYLLNWVYLLISNLYFGISDKGQDGIYPLKISNL